MQALSFDDVLSQVRTRHDRMLQDTVVRIADLRMDERGNLRGQGTPSWRLNDWSMKQLASLLGIRWGKWFETASGDERSEEVNRRLSRIPGERKLRAYRDETGAADGVLRAFLGPAYAPLDDIRIFERMERGLKGVLDAYRFTRVEESVTHTAYAALAIEAKVVGGDRYFPGWHLRNSEVGAGPVMMDDFWLREVCANGLTVRVGGKHLLYRTHRQADDDQLTAGLVVALSRLPDRWDATTKMLLASRDAVVEAPDADVEAALPGVPRHLVEEAQKTVLRDGDRTRHGVVQAITHVAHTANTSPDLRYQMESLAGEYLARKE